MYSSDLKCRAIAMYLTCKKKKRMGLREVATLLLIGKSTLHRWIHANPLCQRIRKLREDNVNVMNLIRHVLDISPFTTYATLKASIQSSLNITMSVATICRCVRKLNVTRKRTSTTVPENDRVASLRTDVAGVLLQVNPAHVISIDETSFYLDMAPLYGYSLKGTRVRKSRSRAGSRKRVSVLMAVATTGVVDYKIYDGSVSGDQFASFVTEMQNVATSHTHILMDNASIHKTATVKASILTRNLRVIYNA